MAEKGKTKQCHILLEVAMLKSIFIQTVPQGSLHSECRPRIEVQAQFIIVIKGLLGVIVDWLGHVESRLRDPIVIIDRGITA